MQTLYSKIFLYSTKNSYRTINEMKRISIYVSFSFALNSYLILQIYEKLCSEGPSKLTMTLFIELPSTENFLKVHVLYTCISCI